MLGDVFVAGIRESTYLLPATSRRDRGCIQIVAMPTLASRMAMTTMSCAKACAERAAEGALRQLKREARAVTDPPPIW